MEYKLQRQQLQRNKENDDKSLTLADGSIIPADKRTKCEVYTRVVGYLRPVNQYNVGKKIEYSDRVNFEVKE